MDPEPLPASLMFALAESSDGITALQTVLLALMPLLLLGSAFFSGSETALFGLTAGERLELRRRQGAGPRAILSMLQKPRLLLIMLLLGAKEAKRMQVIVKCFARLTIEQREINNFNQIYI